MRRRRSQKDDAAARFRMMRGTLLHEGLAHFTSDFGSERLLWHRLNYDLVLSGTPDLVLPEEGKITIFDLKTTRTTPDAVKESHVMQLELYAFLLRANGCTLPIEGVLGLHDRRRRSERLAVRAGPAERERRAVPADCGGAG